MGWNAINVLPFLKHLRAELVVEYLMGKIGDKQVKSGIAWVLGELGVAREHVVDLLRSLLEEFEGQMTPGSWSGLWWESAFALEKLKKLNKPVDALIQYLPSEWTSEFAFQHFRDVVSTKGGEQAKVDQRAVVALVKAHREGKTNFENVYNLFTTLDFAHDPEGRRVYYAIWLFGELRMVTTLPWLFSAQKHPQSLVLNCLAEALGKIVSSQKIEADYRSESISILNKLLNDHYYRTRYLAAEALAKIGASSAIPNLKEALKNEFVTDVRVEMDAAIRLLQNQE